MVVVQPSICRLAVKCMVGMHVGRILHFELHSFRYNSKSPKWAMHAALICKHFIHFAIALKVKVG
jgi:hypothetical protein